MKYHSLIDLLGFASVASTVNHALTQSPPLVGSKSIENAPCLVCPVEGKCSTDGEISPKTCQYIEDWVLAELKTKKT